MTTKTKPTREPAETAAGSKDADLQPDRRDDAGQHLSTDHGVRIPHTDDSLRADPRGPTLLEDFHLREKITRFDHERIPERVVHARGSAAHGYFELYEPIPELTKAAFLNDTSRRTPVFVRFSTVAGSRGSADTVRDVRGFATKFYTTEGQLRPRGQQHPRLLHPGRDQVSRPRALGEARAPPRDAPGGLGARHLLRLHLARPRDHPHADVADVRPGHPAQLLAHGGLRRAHLPAGQRGRQVGLREVALEAPAGHPLARLGRGPADLRARPRLPPPRPLGVHRAGRFPAVGARRPGGARGRRDGLRLRPARPDQDHPRGARPGAAHRADDPRPQPRQLLRGDRAGGLPAQQRRAGHRLHQRPAAPGPALLLPGHPAHPARGAQLRADPDQPPGGAGAQPPAGRVHAAVGADLPRQLPPQLHRRRLPDAGAREDGRLRALPAAGGGPEDPRAQRELRRPLLPGHPLLEQPERAREEAPGEGRALRAEQGRAPGDPPAAGEQLRQRRPRLRAPHLRGHRRRPADAVAAQGGEGPRPSLGEGLSRGQHGQHRDEPEGPAGGRARRRRVQPRGVQRRGGGARGRGGAGRGGGQEARPREERRRRGGRRDEEPPHHQLGALRRGVHPRRRLGREARGRERRAALPRGRLAPLQAHRRHRRRGRRARALRPRRRDHRREGREDHRRPRARDHPRERDFAQGSSTPSPSSATGSASRSWTSTARAS